MFNSIPQADWVSSLLHDSQVVSIEQKRATRRANLARLVAKHGQTTLSERTGIPPAFLYQLSKGRGKAKRNVNDENARSIERSLGLAPGWLDIEHDGSIPEPAAAQEPLGQWPFRFARERFERLSPEDKHRVEGAALMVILEIESHQNAARKRRKAG